MDADINKRYQQMKDAPLTWDPVKGGKKALICFNDSLTGGLSPWPNQILFDAVADRMMGGRYYPKDAVEVFGPFLDEQRDIRVGDRVLQRAPLFWGICVWSMVEIYVAERGKDYCKVGYVTTNKHHGKGIWTATFLVEEDELVLRVSSIASPKSFLFWIGLPFARYLQLRARRRAFEDFTSFLESKDR
jgi:hypothetical protein